MTRHRRPRFDKLAFFKSMGYRPRPEQLLIHLSKAQVRAVACGVRWGKTYCASMEGLTARGGASD